MGLSSVKVPKPLVPMFEKAEEYVKNYFSSYNSNIKEGSITISGERYILIRAESLRIDFAKHLAEAMKLPENYAEEAADHFLYILAKAIGREDAKHFCSVQGVKDPIAKLAAGPVSFSFSGWAFVEILPESKPTADDKFFLVYEHPYSFEADVYLKNRENSHSKTVCVMSAGYSAGWCSESFSVELDSREILCKARGDRVCRFVMGTKDKLYEYEKFALKNIKK